VTQDSVWRSFPLHFIQARVTTKHSSKLDFAIAFSYNWLPMKEPDDQPRLPITTPPQLFNKGFIWVSSRHTFLKTRKSSGISSFLMLPVFLLELLFLAFIIGLLFLFFALYVIFRLLSSLPRSKKGVGVISDKGNRPAF